MRRGRFFERGVALLLGFVAMSSAPTTGGPRELYADEPSPATSPEGTVHVTAATVSLGAPDDPDALPPAARTLGPFFIDRTEVTVAQYQACVASKHCPAPDATVHFPGYGPPEPMRSELSRFCNAGRAEGAKHPMNCIDHSAAALYCAWKGGRLPSDEEWEYAARGADARRFPWGSAPPKAQSEPLCWDRRDSAQGTCAVGQFPGGAAPAGALDMAGNVWEWTTGAVGPGRVVRGGGWTNFLPRFVSATYRWPLDPETRLNCLGFRCVYPMK